MKSLQTIKETWLLQKFAHFHGCSMDSQIYLNFTITYNSFPTMLEKLKRLISMLLGAY